jgi:hypothetical protein
MPPLACLVMLPFLREPTMTFWIRWNRIARFAISYVLTRDPRHLWEIGHYVHTKRFTA